MPLFVLPFPAIDPVLIQLGPFAISWPVLFQLGPLAIRWYGLAYIVGIFVGWWYAQRLVADVRLWGPAGSPMKPADIDDFVVWATIGIVLGGRVGYILFYNLSHYIADPLDLFAVWHGGMSFHGGFLGTVLAMILFARSRGFSLWSLFDVIAPSVTFGLFLGRLANFNNGELWGRVTNVPWGMVFCNDYIIAMAPDGECPAGFQPRHPSQLYEAALEGIVLFLVLRLLTHRYHRLATPGFVSGAFVAGYGVARTFVEFFREPDIQIGTGGYLAGGLTMGMLLSVPMIVAGIVLMVMATRRPVRSAVEKA